METDNSAFEVERRIDEIISANLNVKAEHARLQSLVVEKAKVRRAAELQFDRQQSIGPSLMVAEIAEDVAVDALMAFEAEHKLGE